MRQKALQAPLQDLIIPLPRMTLAPPIPVKQIYEKEEKPKFFGYAVNLTREGIFVPTMNPKPVGFQARIRFDLPDPHTVIEGKIEVVWARDFDPRKTDRAAGMGLKFIDLPEDVKARIDRFIMA